MEAELPMADEQRFDPRFDPAFQRGFDASGERARRARTTPSLTPEEVMYGRSAGPDFASPPPPPPDEATDDPAATTVEVPSPELPGVGHNPFVWALWLLGVVLAGGGFVLLLGPTRAMLFSSNTGNPEPSTIALLQTFYVMAPALITVGLSTLSGLLFWHAAAWKARRRRG
jgi:hypothetical protein